MLEIKLYLHAQTTLDEVRAFVKATESAPGDHEVIRYDFQDEMDGIAVVVDHFGR